MIMTEGKKRQIRRVAGALGHPVRRLTRTHIGMLALGDLAPGQWRELTPKEVLALKTPAPEIKLLRIQPRASPQPEAQATQEKETAAKPRPPRRERRKPRESMDSDDDAPKPRRAAVRASLMLTMIAGANRPIRKPRREPRNRKDRPG
ncbi:MAG: hypothetical protein U0521_07790 [Anaerolineae bacterium]